MASSLRIISIALVITIYISNRLFAQPRVGESVSVSIGYGITAPYDNIDITSSGFYAEGEYVFGIKKWFSVRPYAGFISTSPDDYNTAESLLEYEVSSKSFFFGGKARIAAPIPWFAPFIEIGIGASVGSFVTYTPLKNTEKNGILMHIPVTIGMALGRRNNFDIAFNYYFHNSLDQFNGAATIGFSFPIKE